MNEKENQKKIPAVYKKKYVRRKPEQQEISAPEPKKEKRESRKTPVKIIPLGGLNEIGKNMTVFECSNDMFILDCGLAFPDADMPGVDIVIPDFTYVERNRDKLRGIVLTHGHEDHIGGLVYFLKKMNVPVYGTKLTLGLVDGKLKEHGLSGKVQLNVVLPRKTIRMGCMGVELIKVNHPRFSRNSYSYSGGSYCSYRRFQGGFFTHRRRNYRPCTFRRTRKQRSSCSYVGIDKCRTSRIYPD